MSQEVATFPQSSHEGPRVFVVQRDPSEKTWSAYGHHARSVEASARNETLMESEFEAIRSPVLWEACLARVCGA